ncbi:MAG: RidA family protein, partial [Candidatus Nanopelagicales bacterium]
LSGFASYLSAADHGAADNSAADHRERSQPQSVRGLRRQAEQTYGAILETMAAAGAQPHHLLSTVEYITPEALPVYREVADVRRELLREPYPVSTGIVCEGLPTSGLMIEVVSTAMIPAGV